MRSDGLSIYECEDCGLAYVDPRPTQEALARYYNEGYFSGEKDFFRGKDYCATRDESIADGLVTGYQEIVSNFVLREKKILDIGCASGSLLYSLKKHAPGELVGIDVSDYPISFGRERYNLDLRCTSLENARLPIAHFDLIMLIDVLEHVENLHGFLREMRRLLASGGSIFILTPNFASYEFAGKRWHCLHQDFEHLHYFSPESLRKISARAGFRLLKYWTWGLPFKISSYPRIFRYGLHRLMHPGIAMKNAYYSRRYRRFFSRNEMAGLILYAVLSAA